MFSSYFSLLARSLFDLGAQTLFSRFELGLMPGFGKRRRISPGGIDTRSNLFAFG
jgi:hypothetical protein